MPSTDLKQHSSIDVLDLDELITQNHQTFLRALDVIDDLYRRRKFSSAIIYAHSTASFAWYNHTGLFVSDALEKTLVDLGHWLSKQSAPSRLLSALLNQNQDLPEHVPAKVTRSENHPKKVLHVISKAYETGGHTRLCARWIEQDAERIHSVILTGQGSEYLPSFLTEATRHAKGGIYRLDVISANPVARALILRELSKTYDLIVLHIHAHDVLPLVAFAEREDLPRVAFLNHADHVFWTGKGISDMIINIRDSGQELCFRKRGIARDRSTILPIPLPEVHRTLSRQEAKKRLGIDPDTTLLLSIASGYKYTNPAFSDLPSFVDVHAPFIQKLSNVIFLLIGPERDSMWQGAEESTQGKMYTVGQQTNLNLYHQAADIYVDSFPFASLTSMMEAASYGTPVISFNPYRAEARILRSDDPAFQAQDFQYSSIHAYLQALQELITNNDKRQKLGEKMRKQLIHQHVGQHWKRQVRALYEKLGQIPVSSSPHLSSSSALKAPTPEEDIANRLLIRLHFNFTRLSPQALTADVMGGVSRRTRLEYFFYNLHCQKTFFPSILLSPRSRKRLASVLNFINRHTSRLKGTAK